MRLNKTSLNDSKLKFILNENFATTRPVFKNHFFAATILIIVINIILHATAADFPRRVFFCPIDRSVWNDTLNFSNLAWSFFNSLNHFNWQHTLLNMLCFFVIGLYLERKKGTIKFFTLTIAMIFFTSLAISANNSGTNWSGFSGANFGFYFYIIVDYAFSIIQKRHKNFNTKFEYRFDFIFSTVVLALIYLAMCFNGSHTSFSFTWFPSDLLTNLANYTGALTGLVLAITLKVLTLNKLSVLNKS